jgi:hypothetical protein
MKKTPSGKSATPAESPKKSSSTSGKIHPVVIYPFRQPEDYGDLQELYGLIARLAATPEVYARPITVVDRKTTCANERSDAFHNFRKKTVAVHSDVVDAWCVDTCQMWYTGLGQAYDQGGPEDVYWLIPGDFNYGTTEGKDVLSRLHDLPEICLELKQDICVGEIEVAYNNPKQLIDTYGTFALMYNWFPKEAQEIKEYTERPRSEFFAMRHDFLGEALRRRWYAYEQTMVMLLHAFFSNRRVSRFSVGKITDLPEGREPLSAVVQQVDRIERVLKSVWRERNQVSADWPARYRNLETQSDAVHSAALIILENLVG